MRNDVVTYVKEAVHVFIWFVWRTHEEPSPVRHALLSEGHVSFSKLAVVIGKHWKFYKRRKKREKGEEKRRKDIRGRRDSKMGNRTLLQRMIASHKF